MKRIILLTGIFTFLALGLGYSQTEVSTYLNIDYFKVDPGDYTKFEELINKEWKSIFENEIEEGRLLGSYFYRVIYPGGEAGNYNYVAVYNYKDLNTSVKINEKLRAQLNNSKSKLLGKSKGLAAHRYSELWKTVAGIVDTTNKPPSTYMVINYMMVDPRKEAEYLALENDMARPLHEERISKGEMHSWCTYTLLKPGGSEYNYNFSTADFYEEVEHLEYGFTNELIKSVLPGTNLNKMLDAIYSTREIVRSELWQLVSFLN